MKRIRCKNNLGQIVELPVEKFIFRPSVYGVVIDNKKVVLLKNKSNGKFWFPGGGIELGERIEDALKREILEETGLNIKVGEMIFFKENFFYYQPLDEAYHAFLFFFICKPNNKKIGKSTDFESKNPQWIKIMDVKEEQISDLASDLYKLLRKFDSKLKTK
jgi:ADP-ribose pyrophosphatase YjhB (NUDIX family)